MEGSEGIALSEALEVLRTELAAAQAAASGEDVQFPVESVTVELKVGVTRSRDGKAGVRVPFLGAELGGSAGHGRESVQTVTLVMGPPVDREGNPIRVADRTDEDKD